MREKKLQLIISFPTTTAAMAAEKFCMDHDLPGRLIPIPREITAGCGMSWKAPLEARADLQAAFDESKIAYSDFYELLV